MLSCLGLGQVRRQGSGFRSGPGSGAGWVQVWAGLGSRVQVRAGFGSGRAGLGGVRVWAGSGIRAGWVRVWAGLRPRPGSCMGRVPRSTIHPPAAKHVCRNWTPCRIVQPTPTNFGSELPPGSEVKRTGPPKRFSVRRRAVPKRQLLELAVSDLLHFTNTGSFPEDCNRRRAPALCWGGALRLDALQSRVETIMQTTGSERYTQSHAEAFATRSPCGFVLRACGAMWSAGSRPQPCGTVGSGRRERPALQPRPGCRTAGRCTPPAFCDRQAPPRSKSQRLAQDMVARRTRRASESFPESSLGGGRCADSTPPPLLSPSSPRSGPRPRSAWQESGPQRSRVGTGRNMCAWFEAAFHLAHSDSALGMLPARVWR